VVEKEGTKRVDSWVDTSRLRNPSNLTTSMTGKLVVREYGYGRGRARDSGRCEAIPSNAEIKELLRAARDADFVAASRRCGGHVPT